MPHYRSLHREPEAVQRRTAERLLRLRSELASIPPRTIDDTLLLATWNIREFDSGKYGDRCAECFFYIAEIVSRFDLVAIQEVRDDLSAIQRLKALLGTWWDFVYTDVTEGTAGNGERMAFLFDTRKVKFSGLAGEIVLPDPRGKNGERALQFARTPFLCGFEAGWARFNLCTVHIFYGQAKANDPRRVQEIRDLAGLLGKRAKQKRPPTRLEGPMRRAHPGDREDLILLGDFNIFNHGDATMAALQDAGFVIPEPLRGHGTNLDRQRHYDQIAFYGDSGQNGTTGRAGVFDFARTVFRDDDEETYAELMGAEYARKKNGNARSSQEKTAYYKQWRTFQMSDHLLLWAELKVGRAEEWLLQRAR